MPVPRMHPVDSSAVARIGYDAKAKEAYVEFLGGAVYAYGGVPANVYDELAYADSKGAFVNAVIKRYPFRKISRPG